MKKLLLTALFFAFAVNAFAADAIDDYQTVDKQSIFGHQREYIVDITDDTAVGNYAKAMTVKIKGCITEIETIPVADADCLSENEPHTCCTAAATGACSEPTDNYDITFTNSYNLDVMGTALNNRDTATAEQVMPLMGGYSIKCTNGLHTVNITNQSVDEATVRMVIKTRE